MESGCKLHRSPELSGGRHAANVAVIGDFHAWLERRSWRSTLSIATDHHGGAVCCGSFCRCCRATRCGEDAGLARTPVILENIVGGAGSVAVGRAARAANDGYTLSLGNISSHVLNGAIYPLTYALNLSHCYPVTRN